jgi:hypothetical protein
MALVANSGILGAIVALTTFVITSNAQRNIGKNSMYQKLELASIDFFKWESSNREALIKIREKYPDVTAEDRKLLETYCTQALCLFELLYIMKKDRRFQGKYLDHGCRGYMNSPTSRDLLKCGLK